MDKPLPIEFEQRVVQLCDGRAGLRGTLQVNVSEALPDPCSPPDNQPPLANSIHGAGCLDFIASSETLDRFDEVICADGWQLDNYQRNPVFQNAHQYGDILFTLGKALITEVRAIGNQRVLFQRVEFATEVNPIARIAYGLYRGKFLNAVSVGFVPVRWEIGSESSGFRRRFLEQELLEVSAVGIPANPEALALGLKCGVIAKHDLKEMAELLRCWSSDFKAETRGLRNILCSHRADRQANTSALGLSNNEAQWLQLARDLQAIIK